MKLSKGNVVRCRNEENDLTGVVLLASPNGRAIVVNLGGIEGIRMNGSLVIKRTLELMVDYEAEKVIDLFGNEWEVDVSVPDEDTA